VGAPVWAPAEIRLELLAASPDGCTEVILRAGLATGHSQRLSVGGGGRRIEVARVWIPEAVGSPRVQPVPAWAGRSSDSDAHPILAHSGHCLPATQGEGECAASLMPAGLHDVSDDGFLAQLLARLQTMQPFH
jgi:hypothetical protein